MLGPTILHPGQYDRGQDRQRPPGRAVVTEPGRRCTPLPGNDVCSERTRGKVRGESSGEDTPRSRTPSLLGEETKPPCSFTRRPCVCALINSVAYYRASIWLGSGDTSWRTCFLGSPPAFSHSFLCTYCILCLECPALPHATWPASTPSYKDHAGAASSGNASPFLADSGLALASRPGTLLPGTACSVFSTGP